MLPLKIFILGDGKVVYDDRLTEDEERSAAASIVFEAMKRKIERVAEDFIRNEIDFDGMGIAAFKSILEGQLDLINQESAVDMSLSLESIAAKYPQETADVIAQIMLNRANWRPFLPERRVYILGTNSFYLHRGENAL